MFARHDKPLDRNYGCLPTPPRGAGGFTAKRSRVAWEGGIAAVYKQGAGRVDKSKIRSGGRGVWSQKQSRGRGTERGAVTGRGVTNGQSQGPRAPGARASSGSKSKGSSRSYCWQQPLPRAAACQRRWPAGAARVASSRVQPPGHQPRPAERHCGQYHFLRGGEGRQGGRRRSILA